MDNKYSLSVLSSLSLSQRTSSSPTSISTNGLITSSSCYYSSSPPPKVILSPCAACKILRRRCAEKCILAPYFPPTDPLKFTVAHKVFGASNIIKLLQELPECHREDAVKSLVYEAKARIRDPIYGCAGAISKMQKHINELQAELANARALILSMQCQNANLFTLISLDMSQTQQQQEISALDDHYPFQTDWINNTEGFFLDDGNDIMIAHAPSSFEALWAS